MAALEMLTIACSLYRVVAVFHTALAGRERPAPRRVLHQDRGPVAERRGAYPVYGFSPTEVAYEDHILLTNPCPVSMFARLVLRNP
jgi:hypothetical protein